MMRIRILMLTIVLGPWHGTGLRMEFSKQLLNKNSPPDISSQESSTHTSLQNGHGDVKNATAQKIATLKRGTKRTNNKRQNTSKAALRYALGTRFLTRFTLSVGSNDHCLSMDKYEPGGLPATEYMASRAEEGNVGRLTVNNTEVPCTAFYLQQKDGAFTIRYVEEDGYYTCVVKNGPAGDGHWEVCEVDVDGGWEVCGPCTGFYQDTETLYCTGEGDCLHVTRLTPPTGTEVHIVGYRGDPVYDPEELDNVVIQNPDTYLLGDGGNPEETPDDREGRAEHDEGHTPNEKILETTDGNHCLTYMDSNPPEFTIWPCADRTGDNDNLIDSQYFGYTRDDFWCAALNDEVCVKLAAVTNNNNAGARGDPHIRNVLGDTFDLKTPGRHTLVKAS